MYQFNRMIAGGALALALIGGSFTTATATYAAAPVLAQQAERSAERAGERALIGGLIAVTAQETGLTRGEIVRELIDGKSLAQIAQENGSSADAVIDAARAKLSARLQQAVANGRITQPQADAALARFDTAAPQAMQRTDLAGPIGRTIARRHPVAATLIDATAEVSGLTPQEVAEQWRAGKSLAQIAEENGSSVDAIIAELEARHDARIERLREILTRPGGRETPAE
jgi:DNA-binding CsgD family transcriptional regulator